MKRTLGYVALSTFLFSTMEIVLKMAGSSFSALQMNFLRFTIGGVILLPFALRILKKQHLKIAKNWPTFALTGFLCVVVSMTFFQLAVQNGKAATVAVIFSCNPVFALIFSYLILHEKLDRFSIISVIVSIIGLLVIINPAHLSNPLGLSLALISAVIFGFYSIVSRKGSQDHGYNGIVMTAFTFLAGSVELLAIIGLTHIPVLEKALSSVSGLQVFANTPVLQGISLDTLPILAYVGIGVTGLGFAFYFMAMERSNVATASLVFFIKPGLAPILAMLILGEHIVPTTVVGIGIILIGSMITLFGEAIMEKVNAMQKHTFTKN